MTRLPLNLRSFGIAGLGALGTKITPTIRPDANGKCPAGYVLQYAGSKSEQCTKESTSSWFTLNPKLDNPLLHKTPSITTGQVGPGVLLKLPAAGAAPVQAQVSTPAGAMMASSVKWIPIALGGVGVLGLLFLLLRRR